MNAPNPVSFLAQNLEAIETHNQTFEQAFAARAAAQATTPADDWMKWDADQQRTAYKQMVSTLDSTVQKPADALKSAGELAKVIERFMWASWITTNYRYVSDTLWGENDQISGLGTYIEDRLNEVGVSAQAGVELTGHWYSSNSSHAATALRDWAQAYRETLTR
jgi:hypothetical protein